MLGAAFIDLVYEASLLPEQWPLVLDEMATACSAEGGILFVDNPEQMRWSCSKNLSPLVEEWVGSEWLHRNDRGNRLIPRREPRFLTDLDAFTPEELDQSLFYTDFLRPHGLGWCAGTAIRCPGGNTLVFSIEKAFRRGPVDAAAVQALDAARPDLARAVLLSARVGLERAAATVSALEMLGLAAVILRSDGRILASNAGFDDLGETVSSGNRDALLFVDRRTHRLFSDALCQLVATSSTIEAPAARRGRSIPVPAFADGTRMVGHLMPIAGSARDLFTGATAMLYFTPLAQRAVPQVELLELLFDLTPAEARVASLLAEGRSVEEIGGQLKIATNTVRRHLKSVFSKTGAHRQAELVSLLGTTDIARRRCG